jgi:predicted dehydrogenase
MFKFGIIGAGKISHGFCKAVRLIDNAEVVAVSSKDIDKSKAFAEKENIKYYFGSYSEMLANCDIDAVYIATTHNFHHENALLCLNHGKPVLIEKAMVLNRKQAEEIFDLAKTKNLFVMEAMWPRFLPHINKAREWLAEGAVGKPVFADFSFGCKPDSNPGARYLNPKLGGGALYDFGVYAIELILYIINNPVREVKSVMLRAETGVDLTNGISVLFENDCIAKIFATFAANINSGLTIYGTDGHIVVPHIIGGSECSLYRESKPAEHFKEEYANGFVYEIEETIRCIKNNLCESPVMPHSDTLTCCDIFDFILAE